MFGEGNWARGVPEMLAYYPPQPPLDKKIETLWTLQGLDCSGLLFEATNGATPRNTSQLLKFGRSLLPSEQLKPLDMIIYPGHVLFVRDENTIIESKSPFGVRICSLIQRVKELSQTRQLAFYDQKSGGLKAYSNRQSKSGLIERSYNSLPDHRDH